MSDLSSHDSSLDTTDSPSIDMDNNNTNTTTIKHTLHNTTTHSFHEDIKPENQALIHHEPPNHLNPSHSSSTTNNVFLGNYDDLLFNTTSDIASNMDFLMMDLAQQTSSTADITRSTSNPQDLLNINQFGTNGINMTSPILDFQHHLNSNMNMTPSLSALANGIFDLQDNTNPNTPHLPPLNIDANSQINTNTNNNNITNETTTATLTNNTDNNSTDHPLPLNIHNNNNNNPSSSTTDNIEPIPTTSHSHSSYTMPAMPIMPSINGIGDNIPPPTNGLDWPTFCALINNNNDTKNYINDGDIDYQQQHIPPPPTTNTTPPPNTNTVDSNTNNGRKRKKLNTMQSPDTVHQIDNDIQSASPTKKT